MAPLSIYIAGLGVLGPGAPDAAAFRKRLIDPGAQVSAEVRDPRVQGLASNEARRCPSTVRYALDVGQQAMAEAGWDPSQTATVFSSGSGDLEISDKNCRTLAQSPRTLSPTLFHNSVHNAAAGYWGIAHGSRAATTSLSGYDESFAVGLLEALMIASTGQNCLLIAYDIPAPPALAPARSILAPFAVAVALTKDQPFAPLARIDWVWQPVKEACDEPPLPRDLEALRDGNPAARSLSLLAALARRNVGSLGWPCPAPGQLRLTLAFEDGHRP